MQETEPEPFWISAPSYPPREVEDALARLTNVGEGSAEGEQLVQKLIAELASILHSYDPILLIGQLAHLSMLGSDADAYARFGTEAKVQYLVGVAVAGPGRPEAAPGPAQIQRTIDLTAQIFDLERVGWSVIRS